MSVFDDSKYVDDPRFDRVFWVWTEEAVHCDLVLLRKLWNEDRELVVKILNGEIEPAIP